MDGSGKNLPPRTVEVMTRLDGYSPTVPDELVLHYMRRNGDDGGNDPQLVKLIGLAGERFLASIINDAMQTAKRKAQMSLQMRRQLGYSGTGKKDDKKVALLTEDVAEALKEVGINVRNAPYYVNH